MTCSLLLMPLLLLVAAAQTPTSEPTEPMDVQAAADALRAGLTKAYKAGDVATMGRYLHPDVVVIFPDARVLEGVDALADYYREMLEGPDKIVRSYESDPEVTGRAVHGDAVVSHGLMHDRYVLTDGTAFDLDSKFTVTLVRTPDGPPETGGFVIRSFHSSADAFDNPVTSLVAKKTALWTGAGTGVVALIVGGIAGWLLRRRAS